MIVNTLTVAPRQLPTAVARTAVVGLLAAVILIAGLIVVVVAPAVILSRHVGLSIPHRHRPAPVALLPLQTSRAKSNVEKA